MVGAPRRRAGRAARRLRRAGRQVDAAGRPRRRRRARGRRGELSPRACHAGQLVPALGRRQRARAGRPTRCGRRSRRPLRRRAARRALQRPRHARPQPRHPLARGGRRTSRGTPGASASCSEPCAGLVRPGGTLVYARLLRSSRRRARAWWSRSSTASPEFAAGALAGLGRRSPDGPFCRHAAGAGRAATASSRRCSRAPERPSRPVTL